MEDPNAEPPRTNGRGTSTFTPPFPPFPSPPTLEVMGSLAGGLVEEEEDGEQGRAPEESDDDDDVELELSLVTALQATPSES